LRSIDDHKIKTLLFYGHTRIPVRALIPVIVAVKVRKASFLSFFNKIFYTILRKLPTQEISLPLAVNSIRTVSAPNRPVPFIKQPHQSGVPGNNGLILVFSKKIV
jgi:hypothetical protein